MTTRYRPHPERIIRSRKPRVDYADRMDGLLRDDGFTDYVREYRFAAYAVGGPGKGLRARLQQADLCDWRFDFAWVDQRIAVEIDGGNRMAAINPLTGLPVAVGRHTQAEDYRKINAAQARGWQVYRYTLDMLRSEKWIDQLGEAILRANERAALVNGLTARQVQTARHVGQSLRLIHEMVFGNEAAQRTDDDLVRAVSELVCGASLDTLNCMRAQQGSVARDKEV